MKRIREGVGARWPWLRKKHCKESHRSSQAEANGLCIIRSVEHAGESEEMTKRPQIESQHVIYDLLNNSGHPLPSTEREQRKRQIGVVACSPLKTHCPCVVSDMHKHKKSML